MAAADQLAGLMNLIQGIQGSEQKTKTSGGSSTKQTQLSDDAVTEQINRILAGPGGVKNIGGAARRSGLFNSTTEEQLLGDLFATAAVQGETIRAPTTVTTTPTTSTVKSPGAGLGATIGTIAGASALNAILNSDTAADVGTGITDLIGGIFGQGGKRDQLDQTGVATSFGAGPDSSVGITGSISEGPGGFSGDVFGSQLGQGLSGIDGNVGAGGGFVKSDSNFDTTGAVGSAISGFFSGGPIGAVLGALTGGTGARSSGGTTTGGSIICTALMERGELNAELYKAGSKYIEQVNPLTKLGYHTWATGVAQKIRNGNRFAAGICRPLARGRTALLASSGSFWAHCKHPLGTLTKFVGEPVCWVIGVWVMQAEVTAYIKLTKGEV